MKLGELTARQRELLAQRLQSTVLAERLKSGAAAKRPGDDWPPPVADRSAPLLSSLQQERMWFFYLFDGAKPTQNVPAAWTLEGPLDEGALTRAFGEILRRHEVLRTTFDDGEHGIEQRVHAELGPGLVVATAAGDDAIQALVVEESSRPFDLRREAPIRATLIRAGAERHVLVITLHHIAMDGWSIGVMTKELGALYSAHVAGTPPQLPALPFQYADFAAWQRRWLAGKDAEKQLAYWREQLRGAPPKLEIRRDRTKSPTESASFDYVRFGLEKDVTDRARAFASAEGGTLFMLLLAAFDVVLARHSAQDDIVVGALIAGRTRVELEPMVGVFVNVLPLRTRVHGSESFRTLLGRVKQTTLDAYAHQDVPFERVLEDLQLPRIVGQRPVFQVMLALQNVPETGLAIDGLAIGHQDTPRFDAGADLMLRAYIVDGVLKASLDFDPLMFERATAERFAEHFRIVLESALAAPDRPLASLQLVSAAEERSVVVEWNATDHPLDESRCVHELFEAQVARTPDAVAVEYGDARITYRELDARANHLAHLLVARGCTGGIVAVCMDRCVEMVVALYAVMKAGAAYAPLDPSHPIDRLAFLVRDLESPLVLVTSASSARLAGVDVPLVAVDEEASADRPTSRPDVVHHDGQAAYVIYTSGSTGTPKGVVNVHSGLRNRLSWMQAEYGLTADDAVLQKTPYTFDVSVWEFFWPLLVGARLVVATPDGHKDPAYLVDTIRTRGITTTHFVPSMLALFLEHPGAKSCTSLRRVILSGEALPRALQDRFFERLGCELHNLYGPTEASIDVSYWACRPDGRADVPIGRPIWNTRLYVVDRSGNPTPIGVPGELCIAGVGLARGYWHRPELTAEKFVPDPFSPTPGARMYRTGDLACWVSDGVLEYLGRIDHQVKLRGLRIELGEIESVLATQPGVRSATVVVREDSGGDQQLVAYVEPAGLDVEALKSALRAKLPEYMVPNAFVVLDALPLTTSGKVDRKALPAPDFGGQLAEYVAPRNATEQALVEVFQKVLGREKVGVNDDFFALGGHSLLAMRVVARIRTVLGLELPVRDLFDAATVSLLAQRLTSRSGTTTAAITIPRIDRTQPARVSFSQSRLWFLDQYERGAATYNVPVSMRLEGPLDADILERVLQELVRRHEALRTTFVASGSGDPYQVVHPTADVKLTRLEASSEEEARATLSREVHAPFDLANGPLVRMALIRLRADMHVFLFCIHHIATDGWSFGILLNELSILYNAFSEGKPSPLAAHPIDYVDFAAWQRSWLSGETLEQELAFWKRELAGAPTALEMPTDFPRPAARANQGDVVRFMLPPAVTEGLRALCRREGATAFMVLLAAYQSVLSRWSGQRDIVVGTPIANRTAEALESIVGFFVNTLPMRTSFDHDTSFAELVRRVKQSALAAYSHQHMPFEKLVEELKVVRDLSRTPIFQAFFAMQNMAAGSVELPNVVVHHEGSGFKVSKFDLWLTIFEQGDVFHGSIEYDVALFERATAERLVEHFVTLLEGALAQPDARIEALPLLTDAEKRRVLVEWNATAAEDARTSCVHELFAAQARQTPDAVAVEDEAGARLSYAELDDRAERIAGWLAARNVKRHERVAISVERSADMVAAVLGVLKTGAAYVPIDPQFPEDRRDFMRTDAGCVAELTMETLAEALKASRPAAGTMVPAAAGDLAYVLYTSGSTGRPKGVMVEHRALVSFLRSMQRVPGMTAQDTLVAVTTLSFDIAGLELYLPLICGARVIIAKRDTSSDPRALAALLLKSKATVLQATPATWRMLLADKWRPASSLKMLCGGEAITPDLVKALTAGGNELWNMYGPTETTIWSTCIRLDAKSAVTIGRPISNTRVYILDRRGEPTPVGVPGELHIAGGGVARGYLGRPELTAERFLPDRFSGEPGARMYATGDLARWRADGTLEYLSRLDHQVKVRGYRIELGEIEAVLSAQPGVKQAVVAVHGASEDKRIVAYLVADTAVEESHQQELDKEQLAGWEATWELHYGEGSAAADPTFNLAGWNSSYTRTALPPSEMREWLDNTIAWVRSGAPKRVLEIGVGTGMILFGVAPGSESYWGFDLSQHALSYIERNLEVLGPERPEVKLFHRGGEQIADIATGERDAIVINSVSQYFPSIEYFTELLTQAARVTRPGGTIRIGDVRSAALVEAFHASIQLFRAEDAAPTAELADATHRAVRLEKELVVDPRFFHALKRHIPAIGRVEIEPKRGRYDNEMSRFRYDVTLHIGEAAAPAAPGSFERMAWSDVSKPLREILTERKPAVLAVTGVPNARVEAHAALVDALRSDTAPDTAKGLREALARQRMVGVHPDDLRALGAELSYRVDLTWVSGGARGELDVVFTRLGPDAERIAEATLSSLAGEPSQVPLSRFANRPVQQSLERTLVPRVQGSLKERLPDYMIPSAFVMLDALPLTPNGKVDRKALPEPTFDSLSDYVAPRDATEETLAAIFRELLRVEQIGIHDDFFARGGHSLMAMQLISRMRAQLGREVPLRAVFEVPTVAGLAARLGNAATDDGPALERTVHEGPVPLTYHQAMFWHWEERHPGTSKWNQFNGLRLHGPLDVAVFAKAVDDVFRRHSALRTSFKVIDGQPMQIVAPASGGWLEHLDVASESQEVSEAKARQQLAVLMEGATDLRRERIARTLLLKLSSEVHWFGTSLHRILLDGMLGTEFVNEVHRTYVALVSGAPAPPEPEIQYTDYAVWQRKCVATESAQARLAAYKRRFEGAQPLALPFDRPPPPLPPGRRVGPIPASEPSERGLNQRVECPVLPATWAAIDALAAQESTTTFVVASAIYKAFLARISGQTDIVIIAPTELSRSGAPQLSTVLGPFLDFFVLRTDLSGRPTLREVVQRERAVVAEALANADLPAPLVLDEECPWDSPLAVSMNFIVNEAPAAPATSAGPTAGAGPAAGALRVQPLYSRVPRKAWPRVARFGWFCQDGESELNGAPDLYDASTITALAARFAAFIAESVADPDRPALE